MIAASLRDADDIVDLLLNKEADVNAKSESRFMQKLYCFVPSPLSLLLCLDPIVSTKKDGLTSLPIQTTAAKQPSTSPPRKTISKPPANSSPTKPLLA